MKRFAKGFPALMAALLIFSVEGNTTFAISDEQDAVLAQETDRVIIKMEDQNAAALIQADVAIIDEIDEFDSVTAEVPEGENLADYVDELEKIDGVEYVEPDHLITLNYVPNDPLFSRQYHLGRIGIEQAWRRTKGSKDVLVAVIDGGFDVKHPDLANQIHKSFSVLTNSSRGVKVGNHGTHVAGIIGSSMDNAKYGSGVAPKSRLLLIDVFSSTTAYMSDVIKGIQYAVQEEADILNLSLGTYDYSRNLNEAIQYAHGKGLVIIAASGNDDTDIRYFPSSLKNVIAVGATDQDDNVAGYSNYGSYQDLVAPGTAIQSTLPFEKFGPMTGTSMAAPAVSGVAALLLAKEPFLTNADIEKRLFSTAKDLGIEGKDIYYGHGLLDAGAALMAGDSAVRAKRISGSDRYATAIEISKQGWTAADTIILATGSDFPDALAGGPLAYEKNAPILLTRTAKLTAVSKTEIRRLGASKIIILGSKEAVSLEVEAELREMNLEVDRIGGKNRYETAALIADRLDSKEAVIANGMSFPDVLAVSPYASQKGIPILLTRKDVLPAETERALEEATKTYVIGSTGVVSQPLFDSLPGAVRYGGETRYDTGAKILSGLTMGTEKAYIATGQNFPDALTGSVLAAKNNAPILLVKNDSIPEATLAMLPVYRTFEVFGGKNAVTYNVVKILERQMNK